MAVSKPYVLFRGFCLESKSLSTAGWLGAGTALKEITRSDNGLDQLREMRESWPFFASRLSMLDMVYADKARLLIS